MQPSLLNPGMRSSPTAGLTVSKDKPSSPSSQWQPCFPSADTEQGAQTTPNATHAKVHDMSALPHASSHPEQASSSVLSSPCFVHSYLDKGVALGESLKNQRRQMTKERRSGRAARKSARSDTASADETSSAQTPGPNSHASGSSDSYFDQHDVTSAKQDASPGTAGGSERTGHRARIAVPSSSDDDEVDQGSESGRSSSDSSSYTYSSGDEESSDKVRSLTRQLAETAVGVREMSKQLGRARVKSTIQSVMIITKARDNHLIKLTRELALWLMTTPRNGKDTGLIVYVDSQLKQSKRFDAEGIRRDYPNLFDTRPKRTPSLSSSVSSTASAQDGNGSGWGHRAEGNGSSHQLRYWNSDMCSRSPHLFDFVVTLGGDGTVLFCSWMFQRIVPPVLPFALGSLGFLTNFDFKAYKKVMTSALDDGIRVNLRMRFTATIYRATLPSTSSQDRHKRQAIRSGKTGEIIINSIKNCGWDAIESPKPEGTPIRASPTQSASGDAHPPLIGQGEASINGKKSRKKRRDKEVMCFSTRPVETFEVLNDLVVDRGPSPYVSLLEVFGDEHHMTTAQADGLCISTPTGSTAYSLSAGGSLVHPEIPAILITPICPHTLSFRPMLLPDSMELRIAVPYNSRSTAWASFDGRGRVELKQGDHIKVTASRYPFPTVCAENQSKDWFSSISRTLKWNERQRQKSFVVVEEGAESEKDKSDKKHRNQTTFAKHSRADQEEENESSDEDSDDDSDEEGDKGLGKGKDAAADDENETYDIDDTSTTVTRASSPSLHLGGDGHVRRRSAPGTPKHGNSSRRTSGPPVLSSTNGIPRLTSITSTFPTSAKDESHGGVPSSASAHIESLLNSPDRFGLQGPPQPPKAISERHLLSADFRLDEATQEDTKPGNTTARTSSTRTTPMTPRSALARDATPTGKPRQSSSQSDATSRKAPRRSSDRSTRSDQAPRQDEASSEAASVSFQSQQSGKMHNGGTALVVYGDDESDTDSTTGAGN